MKSAVFSPEELAELSVIDAQLDAAPVTQAERNESRLRDQRLRYRDKIAEAKRAYYEANRDKIAEAKRAYYEANRDKIAEIGEALRRWRMARKYTQTTLGFLLGVTPRTISYWERGEVPINFDRIDKMWPPVMEAFS